MKRLIVVRHAKATHKPGFDDIDRPLTGRGRRDAHAAGRWLRAGGLVPDLVWCSASVRTRQTWDQISAALAGAPEHAASAEPETPGPAAHRPEVVYDSRLYAADEYGALEIIAESPGDAATVMLVGHNPAALQIVSGLTQQAGLEFKPGAVAVVELPRWVPLGPGAGTMSSAWTPGSSEP
jgi:phosphohistidine phosphatase